MPRAYRTQKKRGKRGANLETTDMTTFEAIFRPGHLVGQGWGTWGAGRKEKYGIKPKRLSNRFDCQNS